MDEENVSEKPWLDRVKAEKLDLDDRIKRAELFVSDSREGVSVRGLELLRQQIAVMHHFSRILGERIAEAS